MKGKASHTPSLTPLPLTSDTVAAALVRKAYSIQAAALAPVVETPVNL